MVYVATCEIELLDGSTSTAELVFLLEVGEHCALQQQEVPLGSAEGESSRTCQLAVASQLQCWAL